MENGQFEDVFPVQNGDSPASYVILPEGKLYRFLLVFAHLRPISSVAAVLEAPWAEWEPLKRSDR